MIDFTSRQLRAFLLVAQHRSFSRAAGALFITPSGLSVLIRELEAQLGARLFERTTRHVALTAAGTELLTLQVRSVPTSLAGYLPAPASTMVGVASRWPEFLKIARAVLNAAGFHPDSLVLRDAREADWQRGLKQTAAVVCDTLIAGDLPAGCRPIPFPLLSETSISELKRYEEFARQPI